MAFVVVVASGNAREKTKEKRAISDLTSVATAVESFRGLTGTYPAQNTFLEDIRMYLASMPSALFYGDNALYKYENTFPNPQTSPPIGFVRIVLIKDNVNAPTVIDYIYCLTDFDSRNCRISTDTTVYESKETNIFKHPQ